MLQKIASEDTKGICVWLIHINELSSNNNNNNNNIANKHLLPLPSRLMLQPRSDSSSFAALKDTHTLTQTLVARLLEILHVRKLAARSERARSTDN